MAVNKAKAPNRLRRNKRRLIRCGFGTKLLLSLSSTDTDGAHDNTLPSCVVGRARGGLNRPAEFGRSLILRRVRKCRGQRSEVGFSIEHSDKWQRTKDREL